ncbi:TPA: hypothetical protein PX826_004731 [Escherichia coli]|nr:hypothetical protein [Escherichia coli]HDL9610124.1 hypothetical protein [Escherichia coli]
MSKKNEVTLDAKSTFNALSNAKHIFGYVQEQTSFKPLKFVESDENLKLVVIKEDGEIEGLFTDSPTAIQSLKEVQIAFGDDMPFITVKQRQTAKGQTIYYCEVN